MGKGADDPAVVLASEAKYGNPQLEFTSVFNNDRFPNVVVTMSGTVLLVYGRESVYVRRSADGGASWSDAMTVAQGIHGGGVTVDDVTGHILIFVEDEHPPAPLHIYRSTDDGLTWAQMPTRVLPDSQGHVLAMHFNESGITLHGGPHHGRLLRPARWYDENHYGSMDQQYSSAVFSDDHGATWYASEPFPALGTGEAALTQLGDGSIFYNTRRHWAPPGDTKLAADKRLSNNSAVTRRRWSARSRDGSTWSKAHEIVDLPDGPQGDNYGLFGGLTRLDAAKDVLLFSNCDHAHERRNGALWLSFDGGLRWLHKRILSTSEFGYSSLATGRAGTPSEGWIYCFFESGRGTRSFQKGVGQVARFNVAWLTEGFEATPESFNSH